MRNLNKNINNNFIDGEIPQSNLFPGKCLICNQWVGIGKGLLIKNKALLVNDKKYNLYCCSCGNSNDL